MERPIVKLLLDCISVCNSAQKAVMSVTLNFEIKVRHAGVVGVFRCLQQAAEIRESLTLFGMAFTPRSTPETMDVASVVTRQQLGEHISLGLVESATLAACMVIPPKQL